MKIMCTAEYTTICYLCAFILILAVSTLKILAHYSFFFNVPHPVLPDLRSNI